MRTLVVVLIYSLFVHSSGTENSASERTKVSRTNMGGRDSPLVSTIASVESPVSLKYPEPRFIPLNPGKPLKIEAINSIRLNGAAPMVFDGTEYGESAEHLEASAHRTKHFLRKIESPASIDKERKPTHSSLDVDESETLDSALHEGIDGIKESLTAIVSAVETVPTHPAVKAMEAQVDLWAQETRAGFMGYWDRLQSLWKSESKSVGKKLYEAADSYSHRFFTLLHVKESEHPVLAAKVTRIIVAMGLSLTLVFVIFGLALQLQKSIIARAHEEASKQQPKTQDDREQLFFAMPYPQASNNNNIVVVE